MRARYCVCKKKVVPLRDFYRYLNYENEIVSTYRRVFSADGQSAAFAGQAADVLASIQP